MTIRDISGADYLKNSRKKTTGKLGKALEKLSSGFEINRAADDAARLAISEKTRSILAGLEQGTKNINDGISYLHTQDGAAQQIHDMLTRLEELAVQAANDTYSDVDRLAIDSEYQQLLDEIGQITDTAHFNGVPLFEKHLEQYELCEGVVIHEDKIEIDSSNMPIKIGYTLDGKQHEYQISVPGGSYYADELADIIDTQLYDEAPELIIGVNSDGQFTMQVESGRLDYIGGPGATLFYEGSIGSSDGYLLGVTVFQSERARLTIYNGENDVMSFRLGSDDTLYSVTLDAGQYTRSELIDHMNQKFSQAGLPSDVRAVAETNKDGGLIIGLTSEKTLTGLSGNFIKMDNKSSPIYDIANYGYTDNKASELTGKRVIGSNLEILRGRNDYFTLDLKWYGDDASQQSKKITVKLLDDSENEKIYASPAELIARINEQIGDLPFTASINNSGAIVIKSEQFGDKCNVDLVESEAPSGYMVYDLFDAGTLNKLNPSLTTSRFVPASLTAKKYLDSSIEIPADENKLSFTIVTDSGSQKLDITIAAGAYTRSQLTDALNNAIKNNYPALDGKLIFNVGSNLSLSAVKFEGADIKSISASSSASAYGRLIAGVKYEDSYYIERGKETPYLSESTTMPSGSPAVSTVAGASKNVVNYVDQTTKTSQRQESYIIYNSVTPTIKNGYEEAIDNGESFVGDEQVTKYPATMALGSVMTQFTADGTSLRDISLNLSIEDENGTKSFNIVIPKGSTSAEALKKINEGLGSSATAAVNGSDLLITTASKGKDVKISCGNCTMTSKAYKNGLAESTDAVIDKEHNRVYIPSSMTIPNVASQLPFTVDGTNDKFNFKAGSTNYNLTLEHKTYNSAAELAEELNKKIALSDGGTPKTTVTVGSNGKSLVFKGPAAETGSFTIDPSSTCEIYKTKNVESTNGNPNYNPTTGKIETPATLTAAGFDSHFPMTVNSSNNTITLSYKSPSGTENLTITIPDGTYNSASAAANAIKQQVENDPDLSSKIKVSYSSSGLAFETVGKGSGYTLSNLGGSAGIDKYIKKASATGGGQIDTNTNKVLYPASINNSNFSSLFTSPLEINSSNRHFAITINGTTVEGDFDIDDYSGDAGMNRIVNQLNAKLAGIATATVSGSKLSIVTLDKGSSQTISISDKNTSPIFKKATSVSKESTVSRTDRRCSITGSNKITSIDIHDYDNKMSFEYSVEVNGSQVSGTADIELDAKTYTAQELAEAIQAKIDEKLGSDQLKVTNSNGYITISGAAPSDTRTIKNFSGRLFDKVFQSASYKNTSVHTEVKGQSLGSKLSYIVGRNELFPENEDEIESGKNVTIYTGLNDSVIFDLNYAGNVYKVEFEIPAGNYTREELAEAIQTEGRKVFSGMTDHSGKNFPADFFNASIGLSPLGVPENNTGISSSDKLVFWCKLPDDGRNGEVTTIIDGIRGNSAYRIFYDATKSPQPTTFIGKPDLSDGVLITDENDTIGFALDGTPTSLKIPHGSHSLKELTEILNRDLKDMNSLVRVGEREGHLMFYTTDNGDFVFDRFTGNAADYLVYGGVGRDEDTEIGIHTGRRTDSYIMYDKARIDEHLMRINTTGITSIERALKAINRLEGANNSLSLVRAKAGAYENRSQHSLMNNENYIENLKAAESRMRDANMAELYADYTKNQIITEAQNAVFTQMQENQKSVLNLLA